MPRMLHDTGRYYGCVCCTGLDTNKRILRKRERRNWIQEWREEQEQEQAEIEAENNFYLVDTGAA